jgi:hypothetical protein
MRQNCALQKRNFHIAPLAENGKQAVPKYNFGGNESLAHF